MSGGGPNNANRCARSGTLGAAIFVLLLFVRGIDVTKNANRRRDIIHRLSRQRPGNAHLALSCVAGGDFASPPSASSAIKASVPIRAMGGLVPLYLHGR